MQYVTVGGLLEIWEITGNLGDSWMQRKMSEDAPCPVDTHTDAKFSLCTAQCILAPLGVLFVKKTLEDER